MAEFSEIDFYKSRLGKIEPLLSLKQQQINSLLEITEAVNNNFPIQALVRVYETILIAQLGIQKIGFIVKEGEEKWACISYTGVDKNFLHKNFTEFIQPYLEIHGVQVVSGYDLSEFEFVIPILHKKVPIGFAFLGGFENEDTDTKEEKLKFTQTISNIILVANENKRLFKNFVDQKLMEKELKLAADMQNMLVPSSLMNNEKIEAAAYYKPHKDIGGDYYDFIKINVSEVVFCISDISGKGVAAALLMANFQANLHAIVGRDYSLEKVVEILNKKVAEITRGEKFITLFIAKYNFETRLLSFINAGHNPSILYMDGKVEILEKGSTILGMFAELPFINLGEVTLSKNAVIVNYTDGLTEATNAKEELFDIEGLIAFVEKNHQKPMGEFNTTLLEEIYKFKGDKPFDDDITLLTFRLH